MENSEGWYKIAYNGGKTGYVPSESITQDKTLQMRLKRVILITELLKLHFQANL